MYKSLTWVSSLLLVASSAQAFERQHDSHEHGVAAMLVALEGNELQLVLESPAANFAGFEHAPRNDEQRQVLADVEKQLKMPEVVLALPSAAGCQVEHASLSHSLDSEGQEEHHDDGHKGHDHDEHHDDGHKGHDHDEHHDEGHKGHDHDEHHDDGHKGHDHDEHHDEGHKGHDHDEHHDDGHKGHDHDEHHDEGHKGHDHDKHHDDGHKGHDHEGEETSHSDYRLEYHFECSNPAALKEIEVNLFKHFSLLHDLDVNYIGPNGQGAAELNPENPRFRF